MVNIKIPAIPVQKKGLWPPKNYRATHLVTDTDDWSTIAKKYGVNAGALIEFNFGTRIPEEINWYLRELVGCRLAGPKGHNYSFRGADPAKRKIYIPAMGGTPKEKIPPKDSCDDVIECLKEEIQNSNDRRKPRLECMISKLEQGGDDRVIMWEHIAPGNETPVPMGVRRRPILSKGVDSQWLFKNIRTSADVNKQPTGSGFVFGNTFVTSLNKALLFAGGANLFMFSGMHDRFAETTVMLEKWANVAVGGSSSMPTEYQALHQWARRIMKDRNSVLNCLMSHSAR